MQGQSIIVRVTDDGASLLSVQQIISQPLSMHDVGYVEFEQRLYPIFCFNKALQLQTSLKETHTTVILLIIVSTILY